MRSWVLSAGLMTSVSMKRTRPWGEVRCLWPGGQPDSQAPGGAAGCSSCGTRPAAAAAAQTAAAAASRHRRCRRTAATRRSSPSSRPACGPGPFAARTLPRQLRGGGDGHSAQHGGNPGKAGYLVPAPRARHQVLVDHRAAGRGDRTEHVDTPAPGGSARSRRRSLRTHRPRARSPGPSSGAGAGPVTGPPE
jgi:hypothetical protein